jgi:glycosyltransferase involved in cell wall biosynthesis
VDREFHAVTDQTILERVRKKYNLPTEFILFVGLIEPRKNIGMLIEAFSRVGQNSNNKTDLVIAGRWGWESKSILALVNQLNLEERVHFPGYIAQEDLPALYTLANIFVYPSLYEGFGLPVLEAMACGTPVITSNISSMPELIGESGILVQTGNLNALISAMRNVIENSGKLTEMSEKSLIRAAKFSWKKTAQLTLEAYEQVLELRG